RPRGPLQERGGDDQLPAAVHDGGGTEGGAGAPVPEAVRAGSVRRPAAGESVPVQGGQLPSRTIADQLPARRLAAGQVLLGQGLGGREILRGVPVAGGASGPPGRRPGGHLPGDVRSFLRGPPAGPVLGSLDERRGQARSARPAPRPKGRAAPNEVLSGGARK